MANDEHVALLKQGMAAWNEWREKNPDIRANLSGADLLGADLRAANLSGADLLGADLHMAGLSGLNLSNANLSNANLSNANLSEANLSNANLSMATLDNANLSNANLSRADLRAIVSAADWFRRFIARNVNPIDQRAVGYLFSGRNFKAVLSNANLSGANLNGANLSAANLRRANLSGAILEEATLVDTDLTGADLTGCCVYGVSAWRLKLEGVKQQNLVITSEGEPTVTVDNIEVAQFVYLLLHNEKIRDVIDTITSKAVLILGRFTDERKAVLDALREELRKNNYLPILFDSSVPATRDITETVSLLARMSRFVVADITDPRSIPQELSVIVRDLPSVPVQPLLLEGSTEYGMFEHFKRYPWVLETYRYPSSEHLIAGLAEHVIGPAEKYAQSVKGAMPQRDARPTGSR
jgi:uncharacterized protein YjbI with pentapeptide repeats